MMKTLLIPDAASSAATPVTPAEDLNKVEKFELIKRLLAATETIGEMQACQKRNAEDEKLIAEKMTRGLNRNQAIAVIERQRKFNQALPKAKTETK